MPGGGQESLQVEGVLGQVGVSTYNPVALPQPSNFHHMTDRLQLDGHEDEQGADEEAPFKPLTREEAQALSAKHPPVSPWRVVMAQAVAGLVVTLLAYVITGRGEAAWSALYGAAAVVVPGALLARGMTRRTSRGIRALWCSDSCCGSL